MRGKLDGARFGVKMNLVEPRRALVVASTCLAAVTFAAAAAAGPVLVRNAHFKSPTGNINCRLDDRSGSRFVDCLVAKNEWPTRPAKPSACDVDFFPAEIQLGANGHMTLGSCRGDIGPMCIPRSPESCSGLPYGRSITSPSFRCTSATNGITCIVRHRSRRIGFRIAREGYVLFR
jgi:hypothetical protein